MQDEATIDVTITVRRHPTRTASVETLADEVRDKIRSILESDEAVTWFNVVVRTEGYGAFNSNR